MGIVRGAARAERLAEMHGFGAVAARARIGQIGAHRDARLRLGEQKPKLGMRLVLDQLSKETEAIQIETEIKQRVQNEMGRTQREYMHRQHR